MRSIHEVEKPLEIFVEIVIESRQTHRYEYLSKPKQLPVFQNTLVSHTKGMNVETPRFV